MRKLDHRGLHCQCVVGYEASARAHILEILDSELFKNSDCFIVRGVFLVRRPLSELSEDLDKGTQKVERA